MRLFVAAWPPPAIAASLAGPLPGPAPGSGSRTRTRPSWVPADRLHVTLQFIGEGDPDAVSTALTRFDPAPHAGTVARVGTVTETFGLSVLVVGVGGLDRLAADVRAALTGSAPATPPFRGHVTIARARRGGDVRPWSGLPVVGADVAWPVDEVTLVASSQVDGAHRYRVVSTVAVPPAAG